MDTQVYRDYTESAAKAVDTPKKKTVITVQISPDGKSTYDTTVTERTPKTLAEGDTGFVDFAGAYQPPSPTAQSIHSTSDIEDLLASPSTQLRVDDFSKPALPTTPAALAGHKRRSSGELVTSAATAKTPGFSQLFGGSKAPMLSATQLFDQTQMPSSPMPDAPRSDPVMTRPSPNLNHQLTVSSPMMTSSPILTMNGRPSSTAGEPRDTYTSMRESQERRAARLRKELELQHRFGAEAILEEDEYDDDDDRIIERKRLQRLMSDQASNDWTKLRAPSRPGSRPTSSRNPNTMIDLVTPATTRKGERVDFDMSDDESDIGDGAADAVLPDGQVLPDAEQEDDDEANDIYDELGQTIMRSQPDDRDDGDDHSVDEVGSEVNPEDVVGNDAELEDTQMPDLVGEHADANQKQDGEAEAVQHAVVASQGSAIADSQPKQDARRSFLAHQPSQPSSISYVPGSQYAGATSQELARRANNVHSASAPYSSKVPSSPPLPAGDDTVPDNPVEASVMRQQMLTRFKQPTETQRPSSKEQQEIPESDLPEQSGHQHNERIAEVSEQRESNSVPQLYSTARSHLSASGPSPSKHPPTPLRAFQSQHSTLTSPSPRKAAGVRRFAEIAADPSPPDAGGEDLLDVDAIMSDVMTADDQQFINAMSSPPSEKVSKRRKLVHTKSKSLSPEKHTSLPTKDKTTNEDETYHSPVMKETRFASEPAAVADVLQSSPSKANELPQSTPVNADEASAACTPESVRKREQLGAKAISQLLSARTSKAALVVVPRKKDGKAVKRNAQAIKPSTVSKPAKLRLQRPHRAAAIERDEQAGSPPSPSADERRIVSDNLVAEHDQLNHPEAMHATKAQDRVFALFKGQYNAFYPATWLSSSADGKSHRVRFDDTTVTTVEVHLVGSLDLRIGDQVKVDVPGKRNKTWIVKGFGNTAKTDEERAAGVDVQGHMFVKVQAKVNRNSLPASGSIGEGEGEVFNVDITAIYLTHTMWPHFETRTFTPPQVQKPGRARDATPSTGVQTPDTDSPRSRSRRSFPSTSKALARQTSRLRAESVASSSRSPSGAEMFGNMAFAISYGSNEDEKAEVTRLIQRNGGIVLEESFEELFVVPSISEPTTPSKRSPKKTAFTATEDPTFALRLRPEYESLGFVALLADRHSRRAKYMQALALGLPTLSGRWIIDSLDLKKNPALDRAKTMAEPLDWSRYLLPAGESTYLGGAVRSRTMSHISAIDAKLASVITSRSLLLEGDGVLIVAPKKGRGTWERRKAYAFLTLAIGAGHIKRVADLQEAKALTVAEPAKWKSVYVDGSMAEAAAVLFGHETAGGKKRKRGIDAPKVDSKAMSVGQGSVRIVNDEFVIQSLILGALVD